MPFDRTRVLDFSYFPSISPGGVIEEESGYGNHGAPVNFANDDSEFVRGKFGQSILLPGGGADKHLDCGNDDSISTMLAVSVETILTPSVLINQDIIGKHDTGTGNLTYRTILVLPNDIRFGTGNSAAANTAAAVGVAAVGIPIHVMGVHDGINTLIYINGVWVANAATPIPPAIVATNLHVGIRSDGARDMHGVFHRMRIWRRAMGAAEVWRRFKYPWMY